MWYYLCQQYYVGLMLACIYARFKWKKKCKKRKIHVAISWLMKKRKVKIDKMIAYLISVMNHIFIWYLFSFLYVGCNFDQCTPFCLFFFYFFYRWLWMYKKTIKESKWLVAPKKKYENYQKPIMFFNVLSANMQ